MITTGAPRRAVTDDTESSVGERTSRAIRSDKRQKEAPPRKQAGTMTDGIVVLKSLRIRWGTATPTKDMGPAKAVTVAESSEEVRISSSRKRFIFTPTDRAYSSPVR
jgi:hypothetical protein